MRLASRVRVLSSQHTPVILDRHCRRISLYIEDPVTEFGEKSPLEGLGKEVSNHFRSRAVLNRNFPTICAISHKIVSDIDVPSPLAAGCTTILL